MHAPVVIMLFHFFNTEYSISFVLVYSSVGNFERRYNPGLNPGITQYKKFTIHPVKNHKFITVSTYSFFK